MPAERDEREVRAVQHELEAHEDDHGVAPRDDAEQSDCEQQCGQHDVVGGRNFRHLDLPLRQGDRAHDGDEQQDRRRLERQQVRVEELIGDVADGRREQFRRTGAREDRALGAAGGPGAAGRDRHDERDERERRRQSDERSARSVDLDQPARREVDGKGNN